MYKCLVHLQQPSSQSPRCLNACSEALAALHSLSNSERPLLQLARGASAWQSERNNCPPQRLGLHGTYLQHEAYIPRTRLGRKADTFKSTACTMVAAIIRHDPLNLPARLHMCAVPLQLT